MGCKKSIGLVLKTLLFIFIITLSLKAETIFNGRCVESFYTFDNSTIHLIYSDKNSKDSNISYSINKITTLVNMQNQFTYDNENDLCIPTNNTVFFSSLVGILIGFSILFFSIFLTIKVGAKK